MSLCPINVVTFRDVSNCRHGEQNCLTSLYTIVVSESMHRLSNSYSMPTRGVY